MSIDAKMRPPPPVLQERPQSASADDAVGQPPWRETAPAWRAPMKLPNGYLRSRTVDEFSTALVRGLSKPRPTPVPDPFVLVFDCVNPTIQLEEFGITMMRKRLAYVAGRSERLFSSVTPDVYSARHMVSALVAMAGNPANARNDYLLDFQVAEPWRERRLDAWALYLGLPQRYDTFEVSKFDPERSKSAMGDVEYFSLRSEVLRDTVLRSALDALGASDEAYLEDTAVNEMPGILGTFYVSRGTDALGSYVSYYDVWDLEPVPGLEASKIARVGAPFEVYGRIYYDPETGAPSDIPQKTIDAHAMRLALNAAGRRRSL